MNTIKRTQVWIQLHAHAELVFSSQGTCIKSVLLQHL